MAKLEKDHDLAVALCATEQQIHALVEPLFVIYAKPTEKTFYHVAQLVQELALHLHVLCIDIRDEYQIAQEPEQQEVSVNV